MCCIFSCCVWTLDIIQRVLTFLLACILAAMVVLILGVAIVVGVAYGYNYSMAEFIALGKSDVTVYMRRGQFSDAEDRDSDRPPVFPERRQFGNIFSDGSPVDINNLIPDAAGKARLLADSWDQAKEARKYDGILSKFTPQRGIGNKKESKESRTSPDTNFRVMDNHKAMFFDEENRAHDYFYTESTKFKSVTTKQKDKTPLAGIIKPLSALLFDKQKQGQDYLYLETSKFKTVATKISPSNKLKIVENVKHLTPTYFGGQDIFYRDSTRPKTVTAKTTTKIEKIKRPNPILFDEEDQEQLDFHIESTKLETVSIKTTKLSSFSHIMKKFKPVYIEEDNQKLYNPHKETQIGTIKTPKKISSTESRAFKLTDAKEINRKQFINYNKTTKSKVVKPDIRIRVQSINFNKPEDKKHIIPEQSSDEIEDYNNSEEEDRMVKPIHKEKEKVQQTSYRKMPDVKIRLGNVNFYTTQVQTRYTDRLKTRTPDMKIRVESKDDYESKKYNQETVEKPLENKDIEEQMKGKYMNEKFKAVNKSKIPDIKIQIESESDKSYMETDVEPLEKDDYKDLNNKNKMNETLDESRNPDIKIRLQSKDYNKSNETNDELLVLPLEKDNYGDLTYRRSINDRFQTVNKSRTTIATVRTQNKDYNELDKNNKKNFVVPMDEEDYDDRFDRKTLSWRFRTVDRIKFDDGATRHPYKMQQPPHPYREEDDDVMYKPV